MRLYTESSESPRFYEMCRQAPWGDYGAALIHGMRAVVSQPEDTYRLDRAGPHCIPVAVPEVGVLIVSEEVKNVLTDELGITEFNKVILDTMVRIEWEHWDPEERPEVVAPSGEPEGYYHEFPHDPSLQSEMGEFWCPRLATGACGIDVCRDKYTIAELVRREVVISDWQLDSSSWNGQHIFLVEATFGAFVVKFGPFVTEFGRQVLSPYTEQWVRFLPTRP